MFLYATKLFIHLMFYFNSGRVGELITYWLYLHPDETTLASQYYKELQNMEIGTLIYLCDVQ